MDLIDIGLNLTHDSFDADRDRVMAAAREAGVRRCIITGTDIAGSHAALRLAEHDAGWFATVGVHPHHADELDDAGLAALRGMLKHEKAVAVGECGLDFFRNFSPPGAQRSALEQQLDLAAETGKPLFLHQRGAHTELMDRLRARCEEFSGGIVHCFTEGQDELRDVLDLGFYVGITGWLCDERRGDALRAAVKFAPLDRLMVETDAPYLLPRDLPETGKTRRNEPRLLPHILRRLAEILEKAPETVAEATTRNAEALFRLPALP